VEQGKEGRVYTSLDRDINKFNFNPSTRDPRKNPIDCPHDGEEIIRVMKNGRRKRRIQRKEKGR